MKPLRISGTLVIAAALYITFVDTGIVQRVFDSRSVILDSVTGGDYTLELVDGKRVDRVSHGILVTRVPLALVPSGEHVLGIKRRDASKPIDLSVSIRSRSTYKLVEKDGQPTLIEIE
jgi:hypothetical protein